MPFTSRFLGRWAAAFLLASGSLRAQDNAVSYQTKAERLASVARFVEWPERRFAQPDAPLVVGVASPDDVFASLSEVLQRQRLKGRPVVVRHLLTRDEVSGCHIVFIARTEKERQEPILRAARREGILTVGETESFLGRGGVMALVTIKDSLRLQISAEAARREKLAVSSKLMQLAVPWSIEVGADAPEPER